MDLGKTQETRKCTGLCSVTRKGLPKTNSSTTLIAVETKEGIVVGTDSRTSQGSYISSRSTNKISPISDHIVGLRSGIASQSQAIFDIVKYYAEAHSGPQLEYECLMKNLFLFTTLLNILANLHIIIGIKCTFSIIVAGYDEEKFGQIYAVTIGGYSIRQKIYITGSGSTFLYGYMDKNFKEGMTNEEAVEVFF
uniref:proteasome endopeptidase complex n=1 Tax=Meloidogyne incognita TaxID=6306 RepID=A0A914NS64_MELIC